MDTYFYRTAPPPIIFLLPAAGMRRRRAASASFPLPHLRPSPRLLRLGVHRRGALPLLPLPLPPGPTPDPPPGVVRA
jgi:hypothetical protein